MDATDASFSKFMTVAVDLPGRGVSFWAPPMERASLDARVSYFRVLHEESQGHHVRRQASPAPRNFVFLVADMRNPNHTL